jgi:hypothetical protein
MNPAEKPANPVDVLLGHGGTEAFLTPIYFTIIQASCLSIRWHQLI